MEYDQSHENRVRRLRKSFEADDKRALHNGIRLLSQSVQGRRFLWLFLSELTVFQNAFSPDASVTAFNLGKQSVGQRLIDLMAETETALLPLMIKENQDEQGRRNARVARIVDPAGDEWDRDGTDLGDEGDIEDDAG